MDIYNRKRRLGQMVGVDGNATGKSWKRKMADLVQMGLETSGNGGWLLLKELQYEVIMEYSLPVRQETQGDVNTTEGVTQKVGWFLSILTLK